MSPFLYPGRNFLKKNLKCTIPRMIFDWEAINRMVDLLKDYSSENSIISLTSNSGWVQGIR